MGYGPAKANNCVELCQTLNVFDESDEAIAFRCRWRRGSILSTHFSEGMCQFSKILFLLASLGSPCFCQLVRRSGALHLRSTGSTRCNLSAKHNSWPRSTCLGFDDVRTCRGLLFAKLFPVGCCNLGDFGSQNRFRIPEESTNFKTPNETLAENQKSSGDNPMLNLQEPPRTFAEEPAKAQKSKIP